MSQREDTKGEKQESRRDLWSLNVALKGDHEDETRENEDDYKNAGGGTFLFTV